MIARRASVLLLGLVLSSPAAAQIRAVPAEAGIGTPAGLPVSGRAGAFAPALSAPAFAASLNGAPVLAAPFAPSAAAPSISASAAPALVSAPAAAPAPIAAAAPALEAAAPAALAPAPDSHPIAASVRTFAEERTSLPLNGERAESAPLPLDALFDGRAATRSAAASGPERAPGAPRSPFRPAPLFRRAGRVLNVALPVAAAGTVVLGAAAPHLAMAAVHFLGQASYWIANPLAFMFTVPQIHRILSRRSAEVSTSMTTVGLLSALATTLCFAFDGKDLMMYRNLAQTAGFAAMLALVARYGHAPGGKSLSKTRALLETGGVVLAFTALSALIGPLLMAAIPGVALMSSLLVPFQILSGFGFTYMMYAQLRKMAVEHSAGDSSAGMMWAYLGTKVIWVWSFATMLSLVSAPVWLTLAAGAAFAGVCWLATRSVLSRLLHASWSFLPEKISLRGKTLTRRAMGDAAAFVALAALILVLSGAGHVAFALIGIKAGAASLFAMYLLYTTQNLVAALATSKTLRLQARYGHKAQQPRP
ncbi:MAG TPA: hypothetical protein VN915_11545 [Elusimicrobiota bacterium]|nr:hypothetical protein [Elusimicrobiota bacterium]